jgi:uncharacterized membrane protein
VVGAAVVNARTRRLGALAAALVFLGVFPANVKMALDAKKADAAKPVQLATLGRLPLQVPLLAWAMRVRRSA